ncbi:MAG: TetR/AcrR family transcriptional regulator [Rhodospirillaceae bacterium]
MDAVSQSGKGAGRGAGAGKGAGKGAGSAQGAGKGAGSGPGKAAPGSRRARNAADRRRAILSGARAVFLREGYGSAGMDAIADAAGVSKMTVYRYFDSKEALFAGLVEAMCERILERDPAAPPESLPPADALTQFARRLLRTVYDPDTLALHRVVLAEVGRFPELGELFYRSGPERNIKALEDYFATTGEGPRLDVADPRKAAEEFFELARGYRHLRLLLGIEPPPDAAAMEAQIASAVRRFLGRR